MRDGRIRDAIEVMRPEIPGWTKVAVAFVVVMLTSCNLAAKRRAAEEKARADQAAEIERAKQYQARGDEFRRRDEEAAARLALRYPPAPTVDDSQFEARRSALAKLAANPRSTKPQSVTEPTNVDPDWGYEYDIHGLGHVILVRQTAEDWAISMHAYLAPPEMFAPAGALKHIVDVGPVSWWRVTAGPFDHGFVFKNGDAIEIKSMRNVCHGQGALAALTAECNRY